MQNSVISIRITSLYGSKPLSVAFACKPAPFGAELQVSIGPRPHLSFCAWKTAWLSPGRQVHIGSSPHLFFLFFFIQNRDFGTRLTSLYWSQPSSAEFGCKTATFHRNKEVSMSPRPNLSFCALKTMWLAPELHVSMGPSPHLWFLHAKQRL